MKNKFTHLHVHSHYSILDALSKPKDLAKKAKEFGMDKVAITDHGSCSGHYEFARECKEVDIKPIFGVEAYFFDSDRKKEDFHFILLAETKQGYEHLLKLQYNSCTDSNFYRHPKMSLHDIKKFSKGLIASSACIGGIFSKMILDDVPDENIKTRIVEFFEVFEENFRLEIILHNDERQFKINKKLIKFSEELDIPMILTTDSHYIDEAHKYTKDLMYLIRFKKKISDRKKDEKYDPNAINNYQLQFHDYNSIIKMYDDFGYKKLFTKKALDKIIENTNVFADREFYNPFLKKTKHYPKFDFQKVSPKKESIKMFFTKSVLLSLKSFVKDKKIPIKEFEVYLERAKKEIKIISEAGYIDYFLILADLMRWGHKKAGISFGPARGSVGSSLVAYLLNITSVDPIKFELYFERFMGGGDRIPDIDVDISGDEKNRLEAYLKEKYGVNKVAHVTTFSEFHLKGMMRDFTRVLERPMAKTDKISKMIEDASLGIEEFEQKYKNHPDFHSWITHNKDIIEHMKVLAGGIRHMSKHAAGVIITQKDISKTIPVLRLGGEIITGYPESGGNKILQDLGIIKYDLLGLKTIDIIKDTIDLVKENKNEKIDLNTIDLNDKMIYVQLKKYEESNFGIFQLSSHSMLRLARRIEIKCFDDIVALTSLHRPGPMSSGDTERFVKRRVEKKMKFVDDLLIPILGETEAIILYQEQVLKIAHDLGGMNWVEADKIRKEMNESKKGSKKKLINAIREAQGISQERAEKIGDYVMSSIGYSFNKAHAVGYSMITIQTLFLRKYYFVEFTTALLNRSSNEDIIGIIVPELRRKGYNIRGIDINYSSYFEWKFDYEKEEFIIPFSLIKGISKKAGILEKISKIKDIEEYFQYYKKTGCSNSNKIILAGGFDEFLGKAKLSRKGLIEYYTAKEKEMGKVEKNRKFVDVKDFYEIEEMSFIEKINVEFELFGGFISVVDSTKRDAEYDLRYYTFYVTKIKRTTKKVIFIEGYNIRDGRFITLSTFEEEIVKKLHQNFIYQLEYRKSIGRNGVEYINVVGIIKKLT